MTKLSLGELLIPRKVIPTKNHVLIFIPRDNYFFSLLKEMNLNIRKTIRYDYYMIFAIIEGLNSNIFVMQKYLKMFYFLNKVQVKL